MKIQTIVDASNEVIGIVLEDTLEASVDFKEDTINVKKNHIYLYHDSIESTCWDCFICYINCLRCCKYGNSLKN